MMEKKHRIDDALEAVRSAQEEGIIPGGGVALIRATSELFVETDNEEQSLGAQVVLKACEAPLRQMAINAGESEDIIIQDVKKCCLAIVIFRVEIMRKVFLKLICRECSK